VTLTQQEWDALGKQGVGQIPRNKRGIAFGMILEPLDEADRAYMKGILPAPVRMLYQIPDQEIKDLEKQQVLQRHQFHGEWNYSLAPGPP
jgi:hypothetical protein